MKKIIYIFLLILTFANTVNATYLLIPMDDTQKNHLKSYGIAYWILQNGISIDWLLNYRGGSFIVEYNKDIENECLIRNVSFELITSGQAENIFSEISNPQVNMDKVKLEKAPKIAVYAPTSNLPWDDAVTMVLTYAEIPYVQIYDEEVINGELSKYDWLHLHHEDFTGQFGKFWGTYHNSAWYQNDVRTSEAMALKLGFKKVSQLKLQVAKNIRDFVFNGGFLFAMCSATDSYDISLSADGVDICDVMFDSDAMDKTAQSKLDFSKCFAFQNFKISSNPYEYEFSDIDVNVPRAVSEDKDYFTLFEFSAKWDPVPTMLCQNHTNLVKGFLGQTTAFRKSVIKSSVLVMGENKALAEARYIHGEYGKGTWTFYGGHDPEDYQHLVGDPKTDLSLFPNSPGYRLILNNVLFPAAKKKKLKT